jgi:hypothetical protein
MALPLNVFKTVTYVAPSSPVGIYTAPVGYSGVVLLAQVANVDSVTHSVSFSHKRSTTTTEIVKDFSIQGNDAASLVDGRLILESGDSLQLSGSNDSNLKLTLSILETLN